MRTETKIKIVVGTLTAFLVLVATAVIVPFVNEAFGEVTPYGATYQTTQPYCAVTSTTHKGQNYCVLYKTRQEIRQKTYVNGLFFNSESSKLVAIQ